MTSAQQFDVFATTTGEYLLVLQADMLNGMITRLVAPLIPREAVGRPLGGLNPEFVIADIPHLLMPQLAETRPVAELGHRIGSCAHESETVMNAVNVLLQGV